MYNNPMNDNMGYPPMMNNNMGYGMQGTPQMMGSPQMMAPMGNVGVISIETGNYGTVCPVCGHVGPSFPRYTMGCVSWAWCCCLLWTFPIFALIPLCSNGCKDIEQLCDRCGAVKGIIPANCC
jgi:hypothetical protein